MSTVKSFSVGYNPINESNVFSSGDYISGQVTLDLAKDTDVNALSVKMKGKAEANWTEGAMEDTELYFKKEKYFSVKQFLIQEGQGNNHVSQGCNVYPFTFHIPEQDMPSSFKSKHGIIQYTLEASLSRPMRKDNPILNLIKLKLFNSGYVAMDVNIDKTGFHQGEGIRVVASFHNKSSWDMRPKYCVYRQCTLFAEGESKVVIKNLLKKVGAAVPPSADQTVTKFITIPAAAIPSISNCSIIKVEYGLRVYLDVKYATAPQINFPIIILPPAQSFDEEGPPPSPYGLPPAPVRVMFFDFSSAFNTIRPTLLRRKLEDAGVDGHLTAWTIDYLTERPQYVRLRSCEFEVVVCSTGSPQGTVLSPFLFTIYTSDFTYTTYTTAVICRSSPTTPPSWAVCLRGTNWRTSR
uniref:Arrestin C-terminal-like domain-containing protein n=1 Tax=Neogobius melanostomus TaxID=47308 RepID=A0A8C6SJS2_9GOBI